MTAEEIYLKLKDELTAENESSSSPERIFIKSEGQTICTLGMNRSHEIIFVEFKPAIKDLPGLEKETFVHPHPVEMLHDAGWRQAQLSQWEEAEKLLEIINRSYKKKKRSTEEGLPAKRQRKLRVLKSAPTDTKEKEKKAAKPEAVKPAKPKKAKEKARAAKPAKGTKPRAQVKKAPAKKTAEPKKKSPAKKKAASKKKIKKK